MLANVKGFVLFVFHLKSLFHYTYLELLSLISIDPRVCMMDDNEFRSPLFQRVYQYLRRHVNRVPLDMFSYQQFSAPEGRPGDCLDVLLKYEPNYRLN